MKSILISLSSNLWKLVRQTAHSDSIPRALQLTIMLLPICPYARYKCLPLKQTSSDIHGSIKNHQKGKKNKRWKMFSVFKGKVAASSHVRLALWQSHPQSGLMLYEYKQRYLLLRIQTHACHYTFFPTVSSNALEERLRHLQVRTNLAAVLQVLVCKHARSGYFRDFIFWNCIFLSRCVFSEDWITVWFAVACETISSGFWVLSLLSSCRYVVVWWLLCCLCPPVMDLCLGITPWQDVKASRNLLATQDQVWFLHSRKDLYKAWTSFWKSCNC